MTNRTTDNPPLPFQTDHYPVSISLIDPDDYDVKQYKTWKCNVGTCLIKSNQQATHKFLEAKYQECNESNIFEKYEEFKSKAINYMKSMPKTEHLKNKNFN